MKVFIRTDSSLAIGTGHLMRCLTLAEELTSRGAKVSFICRDLPGNMNQQAECNGYCLYRLPFKDSTPVHDPDLSGYEKWLAVDKETDAEQTGAILSGADEGCDLLIVDHYALDGEWERLQQPLVGRLMVIDDLANRPHDCDILMDQNLYKNMQGRYRHLVEDRVRLLLGPTFVLLRNEFRKWRKKISTHDGTVRKVLVSFGGADRTNETMKFLRTLSAAGMDKFEYIVVIGRTNPHREEIEDFCKAKSNLHFYRAVDDMARLMVETDLAVGA
ncbi:MAG: UDP-2,4-diacetamido-2,4,6-trideoxy-beta-L-altropyranose hydrolase, partial [candidate division Zixibacteria bacterium]|nr:UDP-2,4-diacetamido-2,4,6-trideoxy-beta-L-altropyranose hydrolase [candidate division Zixibacteria bacterium]